MQLREALTFDDVTLIPAASTVLPTETAVDTKVTDEIGLGIAVAEECNGRSRREGFATTLHTRR